MSKIRTRKRILRREKRRNQRKFVERDVVCRGTPIKGSRKGTKEVKQKLYELNGHICYICGREYKNLQLHHVKPIRLGGQTTIANSVLLCDNCHKHYHQKFDLELDKKYYVNPTTDYIALFARQIQELKDT